VPDLRAALNRMMAGRGRAPFTIAETAAMVGDGTRRLVDRAFAARGETADDAAAAAFLADYTAHATELTRPYPDVPKTLAALVADGWRCAICTNKPGAATQRLLEALDLARYFVAIGSGDSFPTRKPDPAHLTLTIAAAGGVPTRAVMVGDHVNDVTAANGANVPCIFAAWGYGAIAMAKDAAVVAQRFAEIPALAAELIR
jgi:phosphoglycolate phosphatase